MKKLGWIVPVALLCAGLVWVVQTESARRHLASVRQRVAGFMKSSSSGDAAETPFPPTAADPNLRVVEVNTKMMESNSFGSKFSWRLTVRNEGDRPALFGASILFLDSEGNMVGEDRQFDLALKGHDQQTFTGFKIVEAPFGGSVRKVEAKLRP